MKSLILKRNFLNEIPFNLIDSIKSLDLFDLSENNISVVDNGFKKPYKIVNLKLNKNKIEQIKEYSLHYLRFLFYLDLSENKLTYLHDKTFLKLDRLLRLNLSYNSIEIIQHNLFSSLKNIERIDLSSNSIRLIEKYSFQYFIYLETLHLYNNTEVMIETQTEIGLKTLKHLFISENQLHNNKNVLSIQNLFVKDKLVKIINGIRFFKSKQIVFKPDVRNYSQEICSLVLNFIRFNLHLNLENDYDYEIFHLSCSNVLKLS
jgi:hypothetical protein